MTNEVFLMNSDMDSIRELTDFLDTMYSELTFEVSVKNSAGQSLGTIKRDQHGASYNLALPTAGFAPYVPTDRSE
jgi:hypothetical protein